MEDYKLLVNEKTLCRFFKGMTLEITSVFVDYDDGNRITFTLRNGTKVVQPRPGPDGVVNAEEMRIWNIVKAHYQCLISFWPSCIHSWVHFHFNDLVPCSQCTFSLKTFKVKTCGNTLNIMATSGGNLHRTTMDKRTQRLYGQRDGSSDSIA